MKQLLFPSALVLIAGLAACTGKQVKETPPIAQKTVPARDSFAMPDESWQYKYDFDGDLLSDSISYAYSGGAHCCYELTVSLTKTRQKVELPFLLEGGYLYFDLSQPDNFNVTDLDNDKVSEIFMNLDSYKDTDELTQLQRQYGFKGTKIYVRLNTGKIIAKDAE